MLYFFLGGTKMWNQQPTNVFSALDQLKTSPTKTNRQLGFGFKIAASSDHSIIMTRGDAVFVFGQNEFISGVSHKIKNCNVPTIIPSETFSNQEIKDIAAGEKQSYFTTKSSTVFAYGDNYFGELGFKDTEYRRSPEVIPLTNFGNQSIKQVATGHAHSIVLAENGRVFACGDNNHGQLGLGDRTNPKAPTEILRANFHNQSIKQVATGHTHSIFLTENGRVFVSGHDGWGQLGLFSVLESYPTEISLDCFSGESIKQVAAGQSYSIFVTQNGKVFVCGYNNKGQLGVGGYYNQKSLTAIPQARFGGESIKQVAAGFAHSIFVTQNGKVFVCGYNNKGQLGIGKRDTSHLDVPTEIPREDFDNEMVISAAVGDSHTIFQTDHNSFYSCGLNQYGELGLGHNIDQNTPQRITFFDNLSNIYGQAGAPVAAGFDRLRI